ncbi:hypothetical protein D3C86_1362630 [compost metagenome]
MLMLPDDLLPAFFLRIVHIPFGAARIEDHQVGQLIELRTSWGLPVRAIGNAAGQEYRLRGLCGNFRRDNNHTGAFVANARSASIILFIVSLVYAS